MFLENKSFDQHKNKGIIENSVSKLRMDEMWPFIKAKDITPKLKVVRGRSHSSFIIAFFIYYKFNSYQNKLTQSNTNH